jgi:hypothetical protein
MTIIICISHSRPWYFSKDTLFGYRAQYDTVNMVVTKPTTVVGWDSISMEMLNFTRSPDTAFPQMRFTMHSKSTRYTQSPGSFLYDKNRGGWIYINYPVFSDLDSASMDGLRFEFCLGVMITDKNGLVHTYANNYFLDSAAIRLIFHSREGDDTLVYVGWVMIHTGAGAIPSTDRSKIVNLAAARSSWYDLSGRNVAENAGLYRRGSRCYIEITKTQRTLRFWLR